MVIEENNDTMVGMLVVIEENNDTMVGILVVEDEIMTK